MHVISDNIEPFAWVEGITYTYPHWFLDITFYLLYNAFGFAGIYAFTIMSGIIIYLLTYFTNVKVCKNHIVSAIITFIAIYVMQGFIAARAQVITFFCLVLEILFIERFLETGKTRYIVGLILDPILLANCHAALFPIYFVVFLPYIAEYLIILIRDAWMKRHSKPLEITDGELDEENLTKEELDEDNIKEMIEEKLEENSNGKLILRHNPNAKWLILIFIACLFTGLLTPIKDIPYVYMYKSIIGNTMNFIAEHQPVVLIYDYTLLGILLISAFVIGSSKVKMRVSDMFMLAGMTVLSLISYKQFPIFFICTMCIINKMVYMIVQDRRRRKAERRKNEPEEIIEEVEEERIEVAEENDDPNLTKLNIDGETIEIAKDTYIQKKDRKNPWYKKVWAWRKKIPEKLLTPKGAVYVSLFVTVIALLGYRGIAGQPYVDPDGYPTVAAKWIKDNLDVENLRLFNDFNYGSYLLFNGIPVFIDGRADVYDPKFNGLDTDVFTDYMLSGHYHSFESVFEKYNMNYAMTTADSDLASYLKANTEEFTSVYDDGSFVIFAIHLNAKPETDTNNDSNTEKEA